MVRPTTQSLQRTPFVHAHDRGGPGAVGTVEFGRARGDTVVHLIQETSLLGGFGVSHLGVLGEHLHRRAHTVRLVLALFVVPL